MLGVLFSLFLLMMVCIQVGWLGVQLYLFFYSLMMIVIIYFVETFVCVGGIVGGDVLSGVLIALTFWICGLMIMSSQIIFDSSDCLNEFMGLVLGMAAFLFLSFGFIDMFWFYVFFELVLIPTLLMILGWGVQPERLQAGIYMLFYTLGASLPLLLGLIKLYNESGSLIFYLSWYGVNIEGWWIPVMVLAFLVKLPMYMVHLWLPKAHVEAPVAGSMILAGVLLKLGGYGLFRFMMMFYSFFFVYSGWLISLCLVGGLIISFVCLGQVDLKSLIAYSSVSHMGLLLGGFCTFTSWGLEGGMVMMVAHGLCSSGLFCLVNIFYERLHTRSILMISGMMTIFPSLGLFWFMLSVGNMAAPPTINLLGEIMLMIGMVGWSTLVILFVGLISFMSAAYSIYMYSSVQHGGAWVVYGSESINMREYLLLFGHLLPLNILVISGEMVGSWY